MPKKHRKCVCTNTALKAFKAMWSCYNNKRSVRRHLTRISNREMCHTRGMTVARVYTVGHKSRDVKVTSKCVAAKRKDRRKAKENIRKHTEVSSLAFLLSFRFAVTHRGGLAISQQGMYKPRCRSGLQLTWPSRTCATFQKRLHFSQQKRWSIFKSSANYFDASRILSLCHPCMPYFTCSNMTRGAHNRYTLPAKPGYYNEVARRGSSSDIEQPALCLAGVQTPSGAEYHKSGATC